MSSPPISGPRPTPSPDTPAQTAMARLRSAGGKTLTITDSVEGMIIAPPMPIAIRVPISWAALVANIAAIEDAAKTTSPSWSARARPNRSPSAPIVRSRPAKTRT